MSAEKVYNIMSGESGVSHPGDVVKQAVGSFYRYGGGQLYRVFKEFTAVVQEVGEMKPIEGGSVYDYMVPYYGVIPDAPKR